MSKVLGEQDDVSDGLDQYFPGSTTDEFLALGLSSLAVISNLSWLMAIPARNRSCM